MDIATMENSVKVLQKTEYKVDIQSNNPIPGHIAGQNYSSKNKHAPPYIHSSTIHNSQDMETA